MTHQEAIKEIEEDALSLRLAEQHIFRSVLEKKKSKYERVVFIAIGSFLGVFMLWILFHCLPLLLMLRNK